MDPLSRFAQKYAFDPLTISQRRQSPSGHMTQSDEPMADAYCLIVVDDGLIVIQYWLNITYLADRRCCTNASFMLAICLQRWTVNQQTLVQRLAYVAVDLWLIARQPI